MKLQLLISLLALSSLPAAAADCLFYKDANRGGAFFEQNSNQNTAYKLAADWNEQITSVWVRDGFYAILFENVRQQGAAAYVYGSSLAFTRSGWDKTSGKIVDGGATFNLASLGFNDMTSSVLCLKE